MSLGPVMIDLAGTVILAVEREMLLHPKTGGVILFTRNYESPEQLRALIGDIHALRDPHLIVGVDQEGGRVQRFREGFTLIPPMSRLGECYDQDATGAVAFSEQLGWLLAAELRAVGADLSFTPVLDLGHGPSGVVGDRAFHHDPNVVTELAGALVKGMKRAGMAATGKHFPGHGAVREDSHVARPRDARSLQDIASRDMRPFKRMIQRGLPAVMPAHIVFPQVDQVPVGYSLIWLQTILRQDLGFQGVIFSDDLSMAGADMGGSYADRARHALAAGCDMVLVCNHPEGAAQALEELEDYLDPASQMRLIRMHGRQHIDFEQLRGSPEWQGTRERVVKLNDSPFIEMNV
jgi:beta-N-acetylhexosaminidase